MANSILFKDTKIKVGDTVSLNYKFKEGDKERTQLFKGILIKITGADALRRTITIRKMSKTGIGIERIIPLSSQNIVSLKLDKPSSFTKAKLFFVRDLTEAETRNKLYRKK